MTQYDGMQFYLSKKPHPLAGVPQCVLDDVSAWLERILVYNGPNKPHFTRILSVSDAPRIASGVLNSAMGYPVGDYQTPPERVLLEVFEASIKEAKINIEHYEGRIPESDITVVAHRILMEAVLKAREIVEDYGGGL